VRLYRAMSGSSSCLTELCVLASQPWEGSVVEAPFLWTSGGQFFLFYSANSYANGTRLFAVALTCNS